MKRVCVYTGNRSEYSRLKSVMEAVRAHKNLELKVIISGSHLLDRFGMTVTEIEGDGFDIDEKIYTVIEGGNHETMAKATGLAIIELTTCFAKIKPDLLLVVGDRYDVLPAVITASYLNIPIAHIQGGEKTGSIDESIRHVITKFAHLHFPATKKAARFIVKIGENPKNVFVTGCPSIDLLLRTRKMARPELFNTPEIRGRVGRSPSATKEYILLIQHPVTTETEDSYMQMDETLEALDTLKMQTILLWPNLDAGSDQMVAAIRKFINTRQPDWLYVYKHIPIEIFFNLLRHASCIVGNSSAGIRESCYFGTPCVNIGTRQNNRECGKNVTHAGYDRKGITKEISHQRSHGRYPYEHIYGEGDAGKKIADHISKAVIHSQK